MLDDEPIWKLSVETSAGIEAVWGSKGPLQEIFDAWLGAGDFTTDRLILEGVTDTCDRAPVKYAIRREDIKVMCLVRAW